MPAEREAATRRAVTSMNAGHARTLALVSAVVVIVFAIAPIRERFRGGGAGGNARANYGVDPNSATWGEVALLPGLGEVVARRVVSCRLTHAPSPGGAPVYQSAADLTKVRGIGDRHALRIAPFLRWGNADSASGRRH